MNANIHQGKGKGATTQSAPTQRPSSYIPAQSNIETIEQVRKVFEIFKNSGGEVRPHFISTGESGSGKSLTIQALCDELQLNLLEINAAGLTKEGTSGNSLSKALSPLRNQQGGLWVVFADEFDKLFLSTNDNSSLAHETTVGVQNEFLKVLEGRSATVFGDYGKYVDVPVDKVLFVFAGAFNGEQDIDVDRLRMLGMKTEFIGRVGLVFNFKKVTIADLENILNASPLLNQYLNLYEDISKAEVVEAVMAAVAENFEQNTIGARILTTLLHQYFINGGNLQKKQVKQTTFQTKMKLKP
jgi:ATP-dependent protease Clp ATPase subunit